MLTVLEQLANSGIGLAIDDFGAGPTSIGYLSSLPFRHLKLERSLAAQLRSEMGRAVVSKILELSEGLSMSATVEGIKTEEPAQTARAWR
jgi:EAL domain-containing protein (putative c-di-GMP-specific phosphodiesterase class I)